MSDQPQRPLPIPKFRTFAGDLKEQKNKRNPETNTEDQTPAKTQREDEPATTPSVAKKLIPIPKLNKIKAPVSPPEKNQVKADTPLRKATNPAYHELQKKINKIDSDSKANNPKPVESLKVGKPIINRSTKKKPTNKLNIGYDTTIITDTKKHNPDFFPAIIKSFSDWIQKILTPKPKATPKYMAADSSTRKGVTQKATTKSGSIFTTDNENLKEQIRKRRREEAGQENLVPKKTETTWSPYTETGYDLLESPDLEQESYPSIPGVPKENSSVKSDTVTEPSPGAEQREVDFDEERWSSPEPEKQPVAETIDAPSAREAIESESEEEPKAEIRSEDKADSQKAVFSDKLEEVDTNTMSVMVLMIIIGLVSVVLVGRLVYQYLIISPEISSTPVSKIVALLENSTLSNLYLTTADLNNVSGLIDQKRQNSGEAILEIALTDTEGNELSAPYVFELLDFSMMPLMKQSITSVRFLSVDQKEELVLLRFNNEENVRGGFLSWEENLSSDLSELYGTTVSNNNFIDQQSADIDTRELINNDGSVITYSLVNESTALITLNENDLERIINLEFKP